jgi:hypothetical protein
MKYVVLFTETSLRELDEAYKWLTEQTEQHAPEWYNGLLEAILSLEEMPGRWPLARDREAGDSITRQAIYGDKTHGYFILFEIRGESVYLKHVRHAARRGLED